MRHNQNHVEHNELMRNCDLINCEMWFYNLNVKHTLWTGITLGGFKFWVKWGDGAGVCFGFGPSPLLPSSEPGPVHQNLIRSKTWHPLTGWQCYNKVMLGSIPIAAVACQIPMTSSEIHPKPHLHTELSFEWLEINQILVFFIKPSYPCGGMSPKVQNTCIKSCS